MKAISDMSLRKTMYGIVALYLVIQLVLIFVYFGAEQTSDQGHYMKVAKECYLSGGWYPMQKHIYDMYIWNLGVINWLVFQWNIFGTDKLNMFFNMLMNIGIIYFIYWLAKRFFTPRTAYISVIICCLLYSSIWSVLPAGSEIPFLFFSLLAYCIAIHAIDLKGEKEVQYILLLICAGILFAVSNYIRPLVVVFILSLFVYMFVKKVRWFTYLLVLLPYIAINFCIAKVNYQRVGYHIYQAETTGVNLMMTSNDRAYGGVYNELFDDSTSTCYIKDMDILTFAEKNKIWVDRSLEWIKQHPFQYAKLYVIKMFSLWVEDSWAERPILGKLGFSARAREAQSIDDYLWLAKQAIFLVLKSLVYYILLVVFVISVWKNRSEILSPKGYFLLLLLIGVLVTCIFPVCARYHYPFMFALIIWAAYGLEKKYFNKIV